MNDVRLILVLSALHLVALGAGAGLLLLALRSDEGREPPDEERGGGPSDPPRRPVGGPPLPDATRARARLRGPERLADVRRTARRAPARRRPARARPPASRPR